MWRIIDVSKKYSSKFTCKDCGHVMPMISTMKEKGETE